MTSQRPHVLVVGGAYGGLSAVNGLIHLGRGDPQKEGPRNPPNVARALRVKPRITVLDERDGFFHSVGAPLGQISAPFANEFWINYEDIKRSSPLYEDVQFVKGTAVGLDMASKILQYSVEASDSERKELAYDYLVLATGTRRQWPVVPEVLQKVQYIKQVEQMEHEISGCSRVVLVGGGTYPLIYIAHTEI
jgi:apoptosis-inducing factor 2